MLQNGGAKDGFDMNVAPAWQKGYTGKGVVVSILDDGIQTNHPDLALNYVSIPDVQVSVRPIMSRACLCFLWCSFGLFVSGMASH
jgi:subtilisin family serine protease